MQEQVAGRDTPATNPITENEEVGGQPTNQPKEPEQTKILQLLTGNSREFQLCMKKLHIQEELSVQYSTAVENVKCCLNLPQPLRSANGASIEILMHCISRPSFLLHIKCPCYLQRREPNLDMLFCDLRHLPGTDDTEIQLPELGARLARVLYRLRPIRE